VRLLQQPPPEPDPSVPPPCVPTAEVFDNATLRTSFVLPGVERMGNPEGHNHNETAALYRRALSVFERKLGHAHPKVTTCRENYEKLLRRA